MFCMTCPLKKKKKKRIFLVIPLEMKNCWTPKKDKVNLKEEKNLWYRCFYPHWLKELLSHVCGGRKKFIAHTFLDIFHVWWHTVVNKSRWVGEGFQVAGATILSCTPPVVWPGRCQSPCTWGGGWKSRTASWVSPHREAQLETLPHPHSPGHSVLYCTLYTELCCTEIQSNALYSTLSNF